MNSGVTAGRVYDALKGRLLSGDLLPGDKLEPARFADELSSSVTPVRDALHRLTGERLVETRTSDGFHLPLVTEPGLRDLYAWNVVLASMAISAWPRGGGGAHARALAVDLCRATAGFFADLARRTGAAELDAQIESANDRLATARVAEARVLDNVEDELRELAVALDTQAPALLLKAIRLYHRRRDRTVPAIVRALYHR